MSALPVQLLNGLASASSIFLVAAGLSLIFGVTRVVNFAHGSLYMLGAYLGWTLVGQLMPLAPVLGFWTGVVGAALLVGLAGLAIEVLILRRIYGAPEMFQLLATFGVVLVVQELALALWGPDDLLGPRAPGLRGAVDVLGERFPQYELLLIGFGPAMLGALWLLLHRTRWGLLVRAATLDREMTAALGVDQRLLFTSVFALGAALAGLGGALQLPRQAVNLHMDLAVVVDAFVVVVVGGMGSLPGAYLAALLIAELQAVQWLLPDTTILGVTIAWSRLTLVPGFAAMAVVLALRPHGLLGRPVRERHVAQSAPVLVPPRPRSTLAMAALVTALAAAPFVAGSYGLAVLTEIVVLALYASSLSLLMGPGGVISFGHAAYFGLGAYGAALAHKVLGGAMAGGLIVAPLAALLGGLAFGALCVRLSGVYLAMLTLAVAQILWAVASQWVDVTGGDNGVLGVWPSLSPAGFYWLALGLCTLAIAALRRIVFSPFGYALRALRDSPMRAAAVGIDRFRVQWAAFAIAAAAAGLAGGLFAYAKGSVFPTYLAIARSVDALLMVLIGGIHSLAGPLVGAAAYAGLTAELPRWTDHWRAVLGGLIVALAVLFPNGLAGRRHGE